MEELENCVVMVPPGLIYDPLFRQGDCGLIRALSDDGLEASVCFPGGQTGRYATEWLWMLALGELVAERLRCTDTTWEPYEMADLLEIHLLDATGLYAYQAKALAMATENPTIFSEAVITVRYWLDNFRNEDMDLRRGR